MNMLVNVNAPFTGSKKRIKAFDFLKLYAIFLVLWGHSIQYFLSSKYFDEPIYRIIYSFHMPLFMMISGYFSLSSMSHSPSDFVKKKFVQLYLPTFTWIIVLGLLFFVTQTHFLTQIPTLWLMAIKGTISNIINGLIGPHPFWFLKTCFFCYMLAYWGSHLRINKYLWMFITLIISQHIPHFANYDIMYPCFIIGMELKDNHKLYYKICNCYFMLLVIFLIMLCFWDQFFWGYDGVFKTIIVNYLHTNNNNVLFHFSKLYRLSIGIIGSLAFIGMTCSLLPQKKNNKFISLCCNWGQYTLGVYILQSIILEKFLAKYVLLDGINFYVFNFIVAPLLSFLILIICIFIIKITSKSPISALYLWGKQ